MAVVTEDPRLGLTWRGKKIVDLSRAFLDTNGAHQETKVFVEIPGKQGNPIHRGACAGEGKACPESKAMDIRERWLGTLSDLNVCSQRGLVEMFDSSIGAGSVLMPYGGKYQMTETQVMAARVPVGDAETKTATLMSYGFDPFISSWSPYHGAVYAVTESVARIVASGGDASKIRFTSRNISAE